MLQCHKTGIYQDQEINYTCTLGNWSVCRNASDNTNESGGLRSFFLMIITKISFDTYMNACLTVSNIHVLVMIVVGQRSSLHICVSCIYIYL